MAKATSSLTPTDTRQIKMLSGQIALRTHLPDGAALNTTCHYDAIQDKWLVKVKIWSDNLNPPGELHTSKAIELVEPLDEFPSEVMIAQAMLVA